MTLWRVDVGGVSHRYIEAPTQQHALEIVRTSILKALDLRVRKETGLVGRFYEDSGPAQRKQLLAALDGLTPAAGQNEARLARRRLARQIRYAADLREWSASAIATYRPIDPATFDKLLVAAELSHLRSVQARLKRLQDDLHQNEA